MCIFGHFWTFSPWLTKAIGIWVRRGAMTLHVAAINHNVVPSTSSSPPNYRASLSQAPYDLHALSRGACPVRTAPASLPSVSNSPPQPS